MPLALISDSPEAALREAEILGRFFFGEGNGLTSALAEHILTLQVPAEDRDRMKDLLRRNGLGELSAAEERELHSYSNAGTWLAIFQSQARQHLKKQSTAVSSRKSGEAKSRRKSPSDE